MPYTVEQKIINAFLQKHKLTKVELIVAGYMALQSQYGPNKIE